MVSAPVDEFEMSQWWRSQEGWILILGELFKLPFYWVRYGWSGRLLLLGFAGGALGLIAWRLARRIEQRPEGSPTGK